MTGAKSPPHPVYGTTPIGRDGCILEQQPIQMLNFWHKKAIEAADVYVHSDSEFVDEGYDQLRSCVWEIYEAAFKTKISGIRDIAALMEIVERHSIDNEVELSLDLEKVHLIAKAITKVAEPARPTKKLRKSRRGQKLTRFGMIERYQAFLIQELETIGWHIYGNRKYPLSYRMNDDAVDARCMSQRHGRDPFFDPTKLTARARAVLKSLKIDAERADPTHRNGGSR